jgi:hypothetical protein
LRARGIGLATISYDSRDVLADFSRRHGITYPLLSDIGSATIRRYGILNTVVEEALGPNGKDPRVLADLRKFATAGEAAERHRGIPFPGTFMVDRQGRVTSRFFEDFYWERNTASNILLKTGLGAAAVPAIQASTQHLELISYPSNPEVAFGTRSSLVVEITPKPGMHVYAPGATGYRVVALNVASQPYVRVEPTKYPPSEIYYFAPLKERVATYQKPFTLAVDVIPEGTAEARKGLSAVNELVLTGTLDYQACDDTICYNPVSVPLTWRIALKPNVAGAAPAPPAK